MCAEYGSIGDLRQLMKFLYWTATYNLSVLNMDLKFNSRKVMKFEYWL